MLVQRAAHAKDRLTGRYNYKVGDGNTEALLVGTQIYNTGSHGGNIDAAFLRKIGGKESMKLIFDNFYQNMFADPRMIVLFGWRNTELPTAEHGRRLATFILQLAGLDGEYGRTDHDGFHHAHQQAKRCPMRPKEHKDAVAFTKQQRNAWLGHLSLACDARGVSGECKRTLLSYLLARIHMYGPFIDEDTGKGGKGDGGK